MSLSHPTVTASSVTGMLTEAEARTKLCPRTFAIGSAAGSAAGCVASLCMAWRIGVPAKPPRPGETIHMANGVICIIPGTERPAEPEKGFCGQFGTPA